MRTFWFCRGEVSDFSISFLIDFIILTISSYDLDPAFSNFNSCI